jgi:hypothetical protein
MRKTLSIFLISGTMSAALAMAPAAIPQALAAPASHAAVAMRAKGVPGCKDSDYSCGYQQGFLKGFAAGRTAEQLGLCEEPYQGYGAFGTPTPSERGFKDGYFEAFTYYCPR